MVSSLPALPQPFTRGDSEWQRPTPLWDSSCSLHPPWGTRCSLGGPATSSAPEIPRPSGLLRPCLQSPGDRVVSCESPAKVTF